MKRKQMALCMLAAVGTLALNAWDASSFPVSSGNTSFALDTTGKISYPVVLSSQAEISAMRQVAYRVGESVTATAPSGAASSLVADASTTGTAAFAPSSGGIWTLANTSGETAKFLVLWSVYGESDVAIVTSPILGGAWIDTRQEGPDRKVKTGETLLPIAYSGDGWLGGATSSSTLTFTPPPGKGAATVFDALSGTGVQPFTFKKAGKWTVALDMADGTTRTAIINIPGGLIISFF